jgi:hypothetical protein
MSNTNATLRVFPGASGVFFILPDGSLWRWGQTGGEMFSRAVVPEQVGTNHSWVQAFSASSHCVAVRADGTLWTWGYDVGAPPRKPCLIPAPQQVGVEDDWLSVAAGGSHSVALKKDGSLWAWGHNSDGQMGNGLGVGVLPIQTNLVQVGTNRDWIAISAQDLCTLGLRADRTLWMWGRIHQFLNGQPGGIFPVPTQICRERNWTQLEGDLVLNQRGELWRAFYGRPDASAPASATCQLFADNCLPGRFARVAWGFCQLHADGTLWETKLNFSRGFPFRPGNQWYRMGKRSDWVSLWGMGTGLGLTADGTIWTWAADPGQEQVMMLGSKIELLKNQVKGRVGMATNAVTKGWITPVQKEPRPLLRILAADPTQPANSNSHQ